MNTHRVILFYSTLISPLGGAGKAILILMLSGLCLTTWAGQDINNLQWVNPSPQGLTLTDVHFAENQFIAVGSGVGLASTNGVNWDSIDTPTNMAIRSLTFGASRWVGVGLSSLGAGSAVSTDSGATWTTYSISGTNGIPFLKAVASDGAGTFVAVGYYSGAPAQAAIFYSSNGESWTEAPSTLDDAELNNVAYLNGEFVAVGGGDGLGHTVIYSSADGISWMKEWEELNGVFLTGIALNDSTYVGTSYLRMIKGSTLDSMINQNHLGSRFLDIAVGGTNFVAVGEGTLIKRSSDGDNWSEETLYESSDLFGITYGNGIFVAVGSGGAILANADSNPGVWQKPDGNIDGLFNLTKVAVGTNAVLVVDQYGQHIASTDGLNWTVSSGALGGDITCLEFLDGRWYEAGSDDYVTHRLYNSLHGNSWSLTDLEVPDPIVGLASSGSRFVAAVGGNSASSFYSSTDGDTWAMAEQFPAVYPVQSITYGFGKFVAVSENASFTSADGLSWTNHTATGLTATRAVAFGGSTFVAVGVNTAYYSINGVTWTAATLPEFPNLTNVMWVDGKFIASGSSIILTSVDGINWLKENPFDFGYIYDAAGNADACVFVGTGGIILITGMFDIVASSIKVLSDLSINEYGYVQLLVTGVPGASYDLYYSPNLTNWIYVDYLEGSAEGFLFEDYEIRDPDKGFYKAESY